MIDVAIRSTLLLAILCLVAPLFWKASAATRHLIWVIGFAGLVVLPFLMSWLPAQEIAPAMPVFSTQEPLVASGAPRSVAQAPLTQNPTVEEAPTGKLAEAPPVAAPGTPKRQIPWGSVFVTMWLVGASAMTLWTFGKLLCAWRLVRRGTQVSDPALVTGLDRARKAIGLRRLPALLTTSECGVPITLGALNPVIILPTTAADWSVPTIQAVLRHECAHIRRADWVILVASRLVCCAYWFNPIAWWTAERIRAESEAATDDRVMLAGTSAPAYAETLVSLASVTTPILRIPSLAVIETGSLKARVKAILDGGRPRRAVSRQNVFLSFCVGIASFSALASTNFMVGPNVVRNGYCDLGKGLNFEVVAITKFKGKEPITWNAKGEVLPLATDPVGRPGVFRNSAEGSPVPPTSGTRYITFRSNANVEGASQTSLGDPPTDSVQVVDEQLQAIGSLPYDSLQPGLLMTQRFDFPVVGRRSIHAWIPYGPSQDCGSATIARGKIRESTVPGGLTLGTVTKDMYGTWLNLGLDVPIQFAEGQVGIRVNDSQFGYQLTRWLAPYAQGRQTVKLYGHVMAVRHISLKYRQVKHVVFANLPLEPTSEKLTTDVAKELPGVVATSGDTVRLPRGTSATIAGICDPLYPQVKPWSPDGTQGARITVSRKLARGASILAAESPHFRYLAIALRRRGAGPLRELPGLYDGSGLRLRQVLAAERQKLPGGDVMETRLVAFPWSSRATAISLRVPLGAFQVLNEGPLTTSGKFASYTAKLAPFGGFGGYARMTHVTYVKTPSSVDAKMLGTDYQTLLYDRNGRPVQPGVTQTEPGLVSFFFESGEKNEPKTIRYEARPYGYAEFKNVQLWPNSADAKMLAEGRENRLVREAISRSRK